MSAKKYFIDGKWYKSIDSICNDKSVNIHNLNKWTIYQRLKSGWSLERALKTPIKNNSNNLKIHGKVYSNLTEACRDKELNKYSLNYSTVQRRLEKGWSLEDIFDIPVNNNKVIINGKEYKDLTQACKDKSLNIHGLNVMTVKSRLKMGYNLEEAFSMPLTDNSVVINGKRYKSISEACRDKSVNIHGLSRSAIAGRLKKGYALEEAFKCERLAPIIGANSRQVVINGKVYKSLAEACRDKQLNKHGLSYNTIRHRVKKGHSLEEAFSIPNIEQLRKIKIKGKEYKSLHHACMDKELNKHGLSYTLIVERVNLGLTLEEAFDIGYIKGYKKVKIFNKNYDSILSACRDKNLNKHNLPVSTIYTRLSRGMSLEEAFLKPKNN